MENEIREENLQTEEYDPVWSESLDDPELIKAERRLLKEQDKYEEELHKQELNRRRRQEELEKREERQSRNPFRFLHSSSPLKKDNRPFLERVGYDPNAKEAPTLTDKLLDKSGLDSKGRVIFYSIVSLIGIILIILRFI